MYILQIEHPVPSYEGWKKAFDSDPINRRQSGVKQYRISRKADDPDYVVIDLEFASLQEAEACLEKLQNLWSLVQGTVMNDPRSRILKVLENENIN